MAGAQDLRIRVLGPVEAWVDGRPVELAGSKQRALLALLTVRRDQVVSVQLLLDELWGADAPATGQKAVQVHVSRLRRVLGAPDLLQTRSAGYALCVPAQTVDVEQFRRLAADGRGALADGRAAEALDHLTHALGLWRGPAMADVAGGTVLSSTASRLDDERLLALEDRIECDLALGRHAEVVAELEDLVSAHPLRERFQAQLMLALYGAGRQSEALATFQEARRTSVRELGLEPGPELRAVEQAILRQDPDLTTSSLSPDRPRRRRARMRLGVATALIGLVAVLAATLLQDGPVTPAGATGRAMVDTGPNRLIEIDPATNGVVWSTSIGEEPASLAATEDALWVTNVGDRTVARLDLSTRTVRVVGGAPVALQVASTRDGDVWLSGFAEPAVTLVAEHGQPPAAGGGTEAPYSVKLPGSSESVAVGGGYLWVTSPSDTGGGDRVFQVDLRSRTLVGSIPVGELPLFAAFGYGSAWVANYRGDSVSVIRPGRTRPDTVPVPPGPLGIAVGAGGVWVVSYWSSELSRIDPESRRVVASVEVGDMPLAVTAGSGSAWVTNRGDRSVTRVDAATNQVTRRIRLDSSPRGIIYAHGRIWVVTQWSTGP